MQVTYGKEQGDSSGSGMPKEDIGLYILIGLAALYFLIRTLIG